MNKCVIILVRKPRNAKTIEQQVELLTQNLFQIIGKSHKNVKEMLLEGGNVLNLHYPGHKWNFLAGGKVTAAFLIGNKMSRSTNYILCLFLIKSILFKVQEFQSILRQGHPTQATILHHLMTQYPVMSHLLLNLSPKKVKQQESWQTSFQKLFHVNLHNLSLESLMRKKNGRRF